MDFWVVCCPLPLQEKNRENVTGINLGKKWYLRRLFQTTRKTLICEIILVQKKSNNRLDEQSRSCARHVMVWYFSSLGLFSSRQVFVVGSSKAV